MKLAMANFSPKHQATNKLEITMWVSKLLFLAIGIVSTSILIAKFARFAFPCFLHLLHSSLPQLRISTVPVLAPRYLFVAINFIIVVIWKLNGPQPHDDGGEDPPPCHASSRVSDAAKSARVPVSRVENPQDSDATPVTHDTRDTITSESDKEEAERTLWPVEDEKHPDGMDATWKAIVESKSSPVKNLPKKSGTRGSSDREQAPMTAARAVAADGRRFRKSETFREVATASADPAARREMRKSKTFRDVWVERDEMLRYKVEAFIKMNYDQMRLQKKEPEQRRLGVVNVSY